MSVAKPRWQLGQRHGLSLERVGAVAKELKLAFFQEIVAAAVDGITIGVARPFSGPVAFGIPHRLLAGDPNAWIEGGLVHIAIERPDRVFRAQRGAVEGPFLLPRRQEEVPRLRRPLDFPR